MTRYRPTGPYSLRCPPTHLPCHLPCCEAKPVLILTELRCMHLSSSLRRTVTGATGNPALQKDDASQPCPSNNTCSLAGGVKGAHDVICEDHI